LRNNKAGFWKVETAIDVEDKTMSYVFEGVICSCSREQIKEIFNEISFPVKDVELSVLPVTDNLYIIQHYKRFFYTELDGVAIQVSRFFGCSLLIHYEGRVGYRSAELYQDGKLVKSFNEADEIWVLVDDDYNLLVDGPYLKVDELGDDPEVEYATLKNAIELGLEAFGYGDYRTVFDAMISANPIDLST
jgi:hypothetical protein